MRDSHGHIFKWYGAIPQRHCDAWAEPRSFSRPPRALTQWRPLIAGLARKWPTNRCTERRPEPIQVDPVQLIFGARSLEGSLTGTVIDIRRHADRLARSRTSRPMIETVPLERVAEAYARMMRDEATLVTDGPYHRSISWRTICPAQSQEVALMKRATMVFLLSVPF